MLSFWIWDSFSLKMAVRSFLRIAPELTRFLVVLTRTSIQKQRGTTHSRPNPQQYCSAFLTKWSASELNSGRLCFNSHRHERVCLPLMLGKPANLTVSTAHQICSTTFNEAKPGLHPAFSAAESAPMCHGCYHQMHGTG